MDISNSVVNVLRKGLDMLSPSKQAQVNWDMEVGYMDNVSQSVSHPDHYTYGKIEVITFVEDKGLNFSLGNVIKYVVRAGRKANHSAIEDLQKARQYIDFELARLAREQGADVK